MKKEHTDRFCVCLTMRVYLFLDLFFVILFIYLFIQSVNQTMKKIVYIQKGVCVCRRVSFCVCVFVTIYVSTN